MKINIKRETLTKRENDAIIISKIGIYIFETTFKEATRTNVYSNHS